MKFLEKYGAFFAIACLIVAAAVLVVKWYQFIGAPA